MQHRRVSDWQNGRVKKGTLTVIVGPMFSNKSGELLRLATVHRIAGRKVGLFKHSLDDRYAGVDHISTHSGNSLEALPMANASALEDLAMEFDMVAIDEAQFFDDKIITVCKNLVEEGRSVVVAGLDRNFKGEPFGSMPALLALADEVMKLRAVCMKCRSMQGSMTQRLIDGLPASIDSPVILIGASDSYEARCRDCHEIS